MVKNNSLIYDLNKAIQSADGRLKQSTKPTHIKVADETSTPEDPAIAVPADIATDRKKIPPMAESFITVKAFNEYVKEGLEMKEPRELVKHIVMEHELTMLFGDTGLGKSVLAFQMAIEMAKNGHRVIYANFELSQLQLSRRFPDKKDLPENVFVTTIDYSKMHDVTDQSQTLAELEKLALQLNIDVIIIDNLTNLCINSKESADASTIMLQLLSLRMSHDFTMVVLAHVPKRKLSDPLTINDLAGSKNISNAADNVIGINASRQDKSKRYLKQLKFRSKSIELDEKNVQELTLTTSEGYLHFVYGDYSEERTHLPRSRDEKAELEMDIVKELKEPNGLSYRDIAEKLGTSASTVYRIAKSHNLAKSSKKPKDEK